jgi:YVTN family beta-propeller protein
MGMVYPISTATRKVGKAITFTTEGVSDTGIWIAMTPDGKTVYVSGALNDTVIPISTATKRPGKPIGRGEGPLFVTPNGKTAYVVNFGSARDTCATVTAINTATNKAGKAIKVGHNPGAIAITP